MKLLLGIVALALVYALVRKTLRFKSLYPFLPRKYNFGKRRDTLRETLRLLDERGAKNLVETGTARRGLSKSKGDGASTVVFGLWAKNNGAHLHSVDIDPESIAEAQQAVDGLDLGDHVTLVTSDSVAFLADYAKPVDFLYLDSYDYHKTDTSIQVASQEHHLKEIEAIFDKLHDRSIILIDDCRLPNGGKGKLAIDFLKSRGWVVHMSDYQVLLIPGSAPQAVA